MILRASGSYWKHKFQSPTGVYFSPVYQSGIGNSVCDKGGVVLAPPVDMDEEGVMPESGPSISDPVNSPIQQLVDVDLMASGKEKVFSGGIASRSEAFIIEKQREEGGCLSDFAVVEGIKCKSVVGETCESSFIGGGVQTVGLQPSVLEEIPTDGPQASNPECAVDFTIDVAHQSVGPGVISGPVGPASECLNGFSFDGPVILPDSVIKAGRVKGSTSRFRKPISPQIRNSTFFEKKPDFRCGKRKLDSVVTEGEVRSKKGKICEAVFGSNEVHGEVCVVDSNSSEVVTNFSVSPTDGEASEAILSAGRSSSARRLQ
ncbi:hypothetical protein Q3G72_003365 [Acer saccharum]|nr:hypothetical protein Q3G72_003365 [Acer saccharum]